MLKIHHAPFMLLEVLTDSKSIYATRTTNYLLAEFKLIQFDVAHTDYLCKRQSPFAAGLLLNQSVYHKCTMLPHFKKYSSNMLSSFYKIIGIFPSGMAYHVLKTELLSKWLESKWKLYRVMKWKAKLISLGLSFGLDSLALFKVHSTPPHSL